MDLKLQRQLRLICINENQKVRDHILLRNIILMNGGWYWKKAPGKFMANIDGLRWRKAHKQTGNYDGESSHSTRRKVGENIILLEILQGKMNL